eukprot:gene12253-biopygen401
MESRTEQVKCGAAGAAQAMESTKLRECSAAGAARNKTHTHAHPMSLACKPAALAARESDSTEREREGTFVPCHCPVAEGMLPLGHRPPGTESEEARKPVGSGGTPAGRPHHPLGSQDAPHAMPAPLSCDPWLHALIHAHDEVHRAKRAWAKGRGHPEEAHPVSNILAQRCGGGRGGGTTP